MNDFILPSFHKDPLPFWCNTTEKCFLNTVKRFTFLPSCISPSTITRFSINLCVSTILETKVVQSQISPDGGLRLTSVCLFGVVDMKPCRIFCSPSVKSEGTTCPKECLHHCWERHVYLFLSSQWGENHEFSLQPSAAAGMSVGSMCWSFHRKNKVFNVSYNRS